MPGCLVPGCTSGYKSNLEKVHFFSVPRDEQLRTLWQIALKRPKTLIPRKQVVCDKHFLSEDILRTRYLFSPEGDVIGVSPYQKPQLRTGAVPCLFPWTESETSITYKECTENRQETNKMEKQVETILDENMVICKSELTEHHHEPNELKHQIETALDQNILDEIQTTKRANLPVPSSTTYNECTANRKEFNELEEQVETALDEEIINRIKQEPDEFVQDIQTATDPLDQNVVLDEILAIKQENLTFNDVFTSAVQLPYSWTRKNITHDNQPLISFSYITCNKMNGAYYTFNLKEVIVDSSLQLHTHVLEKPLNDSSYITVKTSITSIRELEKYLQQIHELNVCKGCLLAEIHEDEQANLIYIDRQKLFRHKECPLLCSRLYCKFCRNAKTSLLRKRKLHEDHEKTLKEIMKLKSIKKNHLPLNLSASGQVYVDKLRQKLIRSDCQKNKLRSINQQLKKNLRKCQQQTAVKSEEHVLRQLQLNDVAKNQYYVVQEILAASHCKDARGHRYSEDWLMLCKLLYIRSPSGYNFIRDNDILPLPCESTMRKNLATSDTPSRFDSVAIPTHSDCS